MCKNHGPLQVVKEFRKETENCRAYRICSKSLGRDFHCQHWELKVITGPFFFKKLIFFYCRIIVLQTFAVFCQTSTWTSHRYTHIPSLLNLPPISLPTPRLTKNPCLSFQSQTSNFRWLSILHMVMEVSMLLSPYISPSSPLSPCP